MSNDAIENTKSLIKGISVTYDFDGVDYRQRAQELGIDPKLIDWVDTHNRYTILLEAYIGQHCSVPEAWINVEMASTDCVKVYYDGHHWLTPREQLVMQEYAEMLVSQAHSHVSSQEYVVQMELEEV